MGLDYEGIFDRMLKSGNLKNGAELSRAFGITPQAVSNYRKKGELPAWLVFRFAEKFAVSVDWLITGVGAPYRDSSRALPKGPARREARAAVSPLASLTPEEIVYVGKLLKILRSTDKSAPRAVRTSIDSLYRTIFPDTDLAG